MSSINPSLPDNKVNDSDELFFASEIDETESNTQSDELLFAPETNEAISINEVKDSTKLNVNSHHKYKLLIVDDEPEIHDITRLLLNDFIFEGKKLEFISAFSG